MILLSKIKWKFKTGLKYCFFFVTSFSGFFSYSQNPTDNCSTNGTALTVGCSCSKINWDIGTNAGTVGACGGTGEDGWGWFTAASTSTTVQYTNTNRDAVLYVYIDNGSSCGGLSPATTAPAGGCVNAVNGTGTETVVVTTIVGNRYYVRVVRLSGTILDMDGEICVFNTSSPPPSNNEPCGAFDLGTPTTTCSYSSYTNCGATASTGKFANPTCAGYSGGDVWFKVTMPASGQITINTTAGIITDGGMAVYAGISCSDTLIEVACDDNSGAGAMPSLSISQPPGSVVFIRFWENGNNTFGTFNLCVQNSCGAGSAPANDDPCAATVITPGTVCNYTTYTNNCSTGSTGVPNPSCGNYQGGDVWFKVTVPASGQLIIDSDVGAITDGGMAAYTAPACNGTFTEVYCDDDGSNNGLMPYVSVVQPAGTVLYIRFWENGNDNKGSFKLCIYDPCPSGAGTPLNNLPCNAVFLPWGINISGNNECSNNTGEPAIPGCFGTGSVNTVWYKFIAASTCAKVKTIVGTIANTQIAVYSGICGGGMTMFAGACNNDYAPCSGGYTYAYSQLDLTGLTVGTIYYIMVDGRTNNVGSFSIMVVNGCGASLPAIQGQDCSLPNLVCNDTMSVADPGYQAIGNICDFPAPSPCTGGTSGCNNCATSCLCSGERGSVWYTINITSDGDLEFWIVPNDYPAGLFGETDYDFALYGPNPSCVNLNNPIRCDYDANGVTGVYGPADNTAPPGYAGNGQSFRQKVSAFAGQTYLLNVSNYTNSTAGFMLVINQVPGTCSIGSTVGAGGTIIWTGAINTDWFNVNNWGGCQIPDCQVNVLIPSFPSNQPVINGQNASCRSLDVNLGASLTVNPNLQLMVCNDYTNSGSFSAGNNSLVLFQDTCTTCPGGINHNQGMSGNMTGTNKFWNVTTNKPAGFNVTTYQNLDMAGNFLVSGAAAFGGNFNATNQYHKIAGNFTVESSPLLSTYTPGATLEFNGVNQTYLNRGQLNNILMNQSGSGILTLQDNSGTSAWMQLSGTGIMTLTYGKIIAATSGNNRVDVFNRAANAVSSGNVNSYVEGALRRYMSNTGGTGSYDFPVGTSLRGYERINFNITTALSNTVDYWSVYFDNTAPATNTGMNSECSATYHAGGLLALNHGFWNIESSPVSLANGTMNVTNYNRSYTNPLGAGWTVMFNNTANNMAANWSLNPFPPSPCIAAPVTAVQRNNLSVPSLFTGNPVWFGTAQSQTPLPVELLNFESQSKKSTIILKWATASEKNNNGFELQRSVTPPDNFEKIGWVDGHGNTSTINYYDFEDKNVKGGTNYFYRLKQIDFNGNSAYSKVVAGKVYADDYDFSIMPNPYSGSTNIFYKLKENAKVKIEVFNAMGQKIKTVINEMQKEGGYQYQFSAQSLGFSIGVYDVRFYINDRLYTKRIVETQ